MSRQNEEQYFGYYGYPTYWGGGGMWGSGLYPYAMAPGFTGYGDDRAERERELEAYLHDEKARSRPHRPATRRFNGVAKTS